MSTLDEVQAASRRMDAEKRALLDYVDGPHEHGDANKQRLMDSVTRATDDFFQALRELGD